MSYGQFCGLARSLDVVGDKWTLLVVRELLAGGRRYGELRAGLGSVPTNLLADRLRRLEADGVVERHDGGYRLTPRGEELREVVGALIRWATPLMAAGRNGERFEAHWLVPALGALLRAGATGHRIQLEVEGSTLHVVDGDVLEIGRGPVPGADAVVALAGDVVLGVAAGHVPLPEDSVVGGSLTAARAVLEPATSSSASCP